MKKMDPADGIVAFIIVGLILAFPLIAGFAVTFPIALIVVFLLLIHAGRISRQKNG